MLQCKQCGSIVSPAFARVLGDNENNVHRCVNCGDPPASTAEASD